MRFPRAHLQKIYSLTKAKGIKLYFLFLPAYGFDLQQPKEINTYLEYGDVLIPPQALLNNSDHWHDVEHLNQAGAQSLSHWLAEEILSFRK